MARPRARMLEVESLEGKQLLSTMHATRHTAPKAPPLALDGDLTGSGSDVVYDSDSNQVEIQLSGRAKSMGAVQGTLIVETPPDGSRPRDLKVVLTNSQGSVTLYTDHHDGLSHSLSPTQAVIRSRFSVQSGTGAYAGASGAGVFIYTDQRGNPATETLDLNLHTTRSR